MHTPRYLSSFSLRVAFLEQSQQGEQGLLKITEAVDWGAFIHHEAVDAFSSYKTDSERSHHLSLSAFNAGKGECNAVEVQRGHNV